MKRNFRNRNRFQFKPLKITLSDEEIMADLQHGVADRRCPERERNTRQASGAR